MAGIDPRTYWTGVVEEARDFLDRVHAVPVQECGEALVDLKACALEAGVPVHFTERPKPDGQQRVFYVRQSLAPRLLAAAEAMRHRGWWLRLEDGWRSLGSQAAGVSSEWVLTQVWTS